MSSNKKAAIDLDALGEKKLSEIKASDFLQALSEGANVTKSLTIWPEKKKRELWLEPEDYSRIRVKDLVEVLQKGWINEKKKVELEPLPVLPIDRFAYENLLNRLIKDIEAKLSQR